MQQAGAQGLLAQHQEEQAAGGGEGGPLAQPGADLARGEVPQPAEQGQQQDRRVGVGPAPAPAACLGGEAAVARRG